MMYCGNCGAKIPEGVKFCPKCGALVKQFSAQKNNNPAPDQVSNNNMNTMQQPNQMGNMAQQNQPNYQPVNNQSQGNGLQAVLNNPKVQQNKTLIIIILIVLVVGGFLFTRTAKFRDMTTDSAAKQEYIDNWMRNNNLDYGVTTTVNGHQVTFKAKEEGKAIDFLEDSTDNVGDPYFNDEGEAEDKAFHHGFEQVSTEISRQWGGDYDVSFQDNSGNTVMTFKNGKLVSDTVLKD